MEYSETQEITRKHTLSKMKLIIIGTIILLILAAVAGFLVWKAGQPKSLIPKDVASQITAFKPYFYFNEVPAGYKLSGSQMNKTEGVAFFSLSKLGRPAITISEQPLPSSLNPSLLLKGGESVRDTAYPAIINSVEGRLVGIMADTDSKTLILLNTTGDAERQDLKDLLQGLKPIL